VTAVAEVPVAERSAAPRAVDDVSVADVRIGHFDYKWEALEVVLCGTIMTILDSTIVNIAILTLQHDLHAGSYTAIAWVVTGYLLAQGAVIPLTGWATDRWGTKRLYLITIVMFTVASMLCGVSQNLGELIFFRVLQGIGGGMLMPIGMTIILLVIGALMLRGFAMGFAMMPTMSAAMARVPRRYTSRASSITNTLQRVSSSVGIAILVTILAGQFAGAAKAASAPRLPPW
jgi:MFS family permease